MKQSAKKGEKNKVGAYGEEIAAKYLKRKGFTILERNYLKKWGEIDLISRETLQNKQIVHYVEVKTVSYETKVNLEKAVSYGTWRPEENVYPDKIKRMQRTIERYGAQPQQIFVNHTAIDIEQFLRSTYYPGKTHGPYRLISVGMLESLKRIE